MGSDSGSRFRIESNVFVELLDEDAEEFAVPDGVTGIADHAFAYRPSLASLTISDLRLLKAVFL